MTELKPTAGGARRGPHVLARIGWLSEQPRDFQDRMMALARWRRFSAGTDLYTVEDEASAVFGLEEGQVDMALPVSPDEMVVLHRGQPGLWIGESALFAERPRAISLIARVDCLVLTIPGLTLRRHLAEHPADLVPFYRLSHANTRTALRVLAETLALRPRARFARLLLRLAGPDGRVPATQAELAAMAGMSRAAFRRAFGELIAAGLVRTEYGAVTILDAEALRREVEAP